jgi:alanine racemase
MRYRLSDIAAICGGTLYGEDKAVGSVITDSRSFVVDEATMFVAISGINHDGHAYVNALYARGVRAFLVERDIAMEQYADAGFVVVESAVHALQQIAADYRRHFGGTVVGITGSNGKTVVKEWIAALAPLSIKLFRSPKSYNSQIGVPLSILMMDGDEDVAVIEAGISRPGEMEALEHIIRPDIGIITNIGDAHQEGFDSMESKLNEKLSLFEHASTIIYNGNYPEIEAALRRRYDKAVLVDSAAQSGIDTHFDDSASRENAATAITVCDVLGYDHAETLSRIDRLHPVAMRLEHKDGINNSLIINDSYNSDINSLTIALDYMKSVAGSRKMTLVLSDILQSGYSEEELYERVAALVMRSGIDKMIGIGSHIKNHAALFRIPAEFYPTTESYISAMRRDDIADRAILLKGNRDSQFERLSHALESKSHTTVMDISIDAMIHNLNAYRARIASGVKLMAMIKAAGYGNGSYEIAGMLQREGVHFLAVAFADEGVQLRERGITIPIVVLNADSDSFELMIANRLEPEIYNRKSFKEFIAAVNRHGERLYPIHIKIDSGMHRLGFEAGDIEWLTGQLDKHHTQVRAASIFSHLACADDPAEDEFTRSQIALFDRLSSQIIKSLPYKPLRHIANSAGIERFPEARFDMVRLGLGLYGFGASGDMELRPVSTLRSRIVQIKSLNAGESVGYGREGRIDRPSRIATVPVGYADGLDRRLGGGRWSFIVGGAQVPTVGRISMDTCAIDVTGVDIDEGGEVIIFGETQGHGIADMARQLGTIPYEIMTGISARVKRVYVKE